jgi:hypothetical protein
LHTEDTSPPCRWGANCKYGREKGVRKTAQGATATDNPVRQSTLAVEGIAARGDGTDYDVVVAAKLRVELGNFGAKALIVAFSRCKPHGKLRVGRRGRQTGNVYRSRGWRQTRNVYRSRGGEHKVNHKTHARLQKDGVTTAKDERSTTNL